MARRSRPMRGRAEGKPASTPPWLITFSDFMTLMLAFFVMLSAMSAVDARRQRTVLGSLSEGFGLADGRANPLALGEQQTANEAGPMNGLEDAEPLRDRPFDDARDVRLAENRLVRIVSVSSAALFAPGGVRLSDGGRKLLERLAPLVNEARRPVLLAGHAGEPRDELGAAAALLPEGSMEPAWMLSLARALAVRQGLIAAGADPKRLRAEGFADKHPRFAPDTAQGRAMNRRVDLVFDRRGEPLPEAAPDAAPFLDFRGFRFGLGDDAPGSPGGTPAGQAGRASGAKPGARAKGR